LAKFHQIPSPQKFSIKYSLISTHRGFPEFLLPNHFESRESAMEKVVHLSEIFKTIFCFKFLETKKVLFEAVKFVKEFETI
jgi:hypothetical protein